MSGTNCYLTNHVVMWERKCLQNLVMKPNWFQQLTATVVLLPDVNVHSVCSRGLIESGRWITATQQVCPC